MISLQNKLMRFESADWGLTSTVGFLRPLRGLPYTNATYPTLTRGATIFRPLRGLQN